MSLLSISTDSKTVKGEKYGVLTGVMYLAPHTESGFNTCAFASKGCASSCLYTAGRGAFSSVQQARLKRTQMFFNQRSEFWEQLIKDITLLNSKAANQSMIPAVRLNGTSDLPWERIPVVINGERKAENIFSLFPDIQFYDYTKRPNRYNLPENYNLTFSLSEDNMEDAKKHLENGVNVAMVFNTKKGKDLPESFMGYNVIDGDLTDLRFQDPRTSIVGLRAKGRARKDTSGFVQHV